MSTGTHLGRTGCRAKPFLSSANPLVRSSFALWITAFSCLLACAGASALPTDRTLTQYVRDQWQAPALPHDNVTAIAQTPDGYLWVGTVDGLARFDGVRSVTFDKTTSAAISNNWIRALHVDRIGRLWIGTLGGGMTVYADGAFSHIGRHQGFHATTVLSLTEDQRGRIWVGTQSQGVWVVDGTSIAQAPGTELLADAAVAAVHFARSGDLYLGGPRGLFRLDPVLGLQRVAGLSDERVKTIAESSRGLWVGTENGGLNRLHDEGVQVYANSDGLRHPRIWTVFVDAGDQVWVGTDGGGLHRIRDGRIESLHSDNGLNSDFIWAIHEDTTGNLWIGTNGGGLHVLRDSLFVTSGSPEGLPSDFVWSVMESSEGSLWIGMEEHGLARVERNGRLIHYRRDEPYSVRSLLELDDGRVLAGLWDGLVEVVDDELVTLPYASLTGRTVTSMVEGDPGELWIGTLNGELFRINGDDLRLIDNLGQGTGVGILSLLMASDSTLWVGSLRGVHCLKDDQWRAFGVDDGLPSDYVTALFEAPDGAIWAGTRGGLARIRRLSVRSITAAEGLVDDAIMAAELDLEGGIWMGGNRGLSRVDIDDAEAVLDGRKSKVEQRSFGLESGLRSLEVNASGNSSWLGLQGQLWFATRSGVVSIRPRSPATEPYSPRVYIEDVSADDQKLDGEGPWRLPAGIRQLEIRYTAIDLDAPYGTLLHHQLVGFDHDWVDARIDRTAQYANLPPGDYTFRVRARSHAGVWNRQGASMEFSVAPHYWQTWWFRMLVVWLLLGITFAIYRLRLRGLEQQKRELESLVAARTLALEGANRRLSQLANEDGLTGIANRRHFDETLDAECRRASRTGASLALFLLDVDRFKAYNDRYGHLLGDRCLKLVAQVLANRHRRAGDLVARYGGEEFAVIVPGCDESDARVVADLVRTDVQDLAIEHDQSDAARVVTVSVGVAVAAQPQELTPDVLLARADAALYQAKSMGRNAVAIASEPGAAPEDRGFG